MLDKYIYNFLYFVNHVSTKLTSWSWCKLYSDRRKGYGYRKKEKTLHEELMEGFEQEKKMYEEE